MARRHFSTLLDEAQGLLELDERLEGKSRPGDVATRLHVHRKLMSHILALLKNVKRTRKTGEKDGEEGSTES